MDLGYHSFYAKCVWKLISGQNANLADEEIYGELERVFGELKDGILHFYTPCSTTDANAKKQIPESLHGLVYELHVLLGLDIVRTWGVLTNYLKHELHGSVQGLIAYLKDDSRMTMLISDVWLFHWSDRLYRHKCMNFLLTYFQLESHKYQHVFRHVLTHENQLEVFTSQVKQLENLINSEVPVVRTHGRLMTRRMQVIWLSYILWEQLEVLHNILLCIENGFHTKDHSLELFSVILNHSFAADVDVYAYILSDNHKEVLKQIAYMETIVAIRAFQMLGKEHFLEQNFEQLKHFIDGMKCSGLIESSLVYMYITAMICAATQEPNLQEVAVKTECFEFLKKMLDHRMFKVPALYTTIAHCTVHDMIQLLTTVFQTESLQQINEFYSIVTVLLSHDKIAQYFFQSSSDNGLFLLFTEAVKYFPKDSTLIKMVEYLSACAPKYINRLLEMLMNLPTFLEVLTDERKKMVKDGEWILAPSDYKPLKHTTFVIPRGAVGTMLADSPYEIIWKCKFNFFFILAEYILEFQRKIMTSPEQIKEEEILAVVSSFKCLANFVKSGCTLSEEMIICLDPLFPIIGMIRRCILSVPTELVAACLECAVALHLQFPDDVCTHLERLYLVPAVNTGSEIREDAVAAIFRSLPSSVIITTVASKECSRGEYPLLKAYFVLLQKILREPTVEVRNLNISSGFVDVTSVERYPSLVLAGTVCMLRDVFPNIHLWFFKEEEEREHMMLQCLNIVHWILSIDTDTLQNNKSSSVSLLHSLCIYSVLHTLAGKTLLKIVSTGETYIQAVMEKELSWMNGRGATLIHLIHLALSVLNQVILAKNGNRESTYSCALEYELYEFSPEKSKFQMPLVVANYVFNCFNPNLRTMAIVLLKTFAQDKPKSLLPLLSLDPSMIRFMFIGPLLSELESDNLKLAIMELITISFQTQPALANEFLNIEHMQQKQCDPQTQEIIRDVEDGCLPFIYSILKGQGSSSKSLFEAVICFLHAVWTGNYEFVLEILRCEETFWSLFFAPLYSPQNYGWDVYRQIFDIIALEVYTFSGKVASVLLNHLETFYACDDNIEMWFKVFEEIFVKMEFIDKKWNDAISFFVAWKNYLLIQLASSGLKESQKLVIYTYSIKIFLKTLGDVDKSEITEHISELLGILTGNSHGDFILNHHIVLEDLKEVLGKTSQFYNVIPTYAKSAISMFVLELMENVVDLISQEPDAAVSLMNSICIIVRKDLSHLPALINLADVVDDEDKQNTKRARKTKQWQREIKACNLNLSVLRQLLLILPNRSELSSYIERNKVFSILFSSASDALQQPVFFDIAVTLMDILLILVTMPFSQCMIFSGVMETLALNLLPPHDKLNYTAVLTGGFKKFRHWTCTKWPQVYIPALQMLTYLLHTYKFYYLEEIITFVDCHIDCIVSSIISFRYTFSADLPKAAIHLVHELSKHQYRARTTHFPKMDLLLRAVKQCLQSSIWLLIYPKYIRYILRNVCLVSESEMFNIPPPLLCFQNDLLDLITVCHQVLFLYSPDLFDLTLNCTGEVINRNLILSLHPTSVDSKMAEQVLSEEERKCLQNTNITFSLLTSFVSFCTAIISKMGRASSSPSRPRHGVSSSYSENFTAVWESSLNKHNLVSALEICLNLLLCQSMLVLKKPDVLKVEKNCLRKLMSNELVSFVGFAKKCLKSPDITLALKSSVERMSVRTISSEHLLEDKWSRCSTLSTVEMLSVCSQVPSSVEMMKLVPNAETFLEKLNGVGMSVNENLTPTPKTSSTSLTFFKEQSNTKIAEESKSRHFEDFNTLKEDEESLPITMLLASKPVEEFANHSDEEDGEQKIERQKGNDDNEVEENVEVTDAEVSEKGLKVSSAETSFSTVGMSETFFGAEFEDSVEFLSLMAYLIEVLYD